MRRDLFGDLRHRADRHTEHDQIRARDGLGGGLIDGIDQPDFQRGVARLGRARVTDDLARQTLLAHRMGHRRSDQAEPDQRDPLVELAHLGTSIPPALKTPIRCATRRQDGSSPTVMRRQLGRL